MLKKKTACLGLASLCLALIGSEAFAYGKVTGCGATYLCCKNGGGSYWLAVPNGDSCSYASGSGVTNCTSSSQINFPGGSSPYSGNSNNFEHCATAAFS